MHLPDITQSEDINSSETPYGSIHTCKCMLALLDKWQIKKQKQGTRQLGKDDMHNSPKLLKESAET